MSILATKWDADFLLRSDVFRVVDEYWPPANPLYHREEWPTLAQLRAWLAQYAPIVSGAGARIDFVPQGPKPRTWEEHYEVRIYERGEVQTREQDWHDFFNAFTWICFPKAKVAVNARHYGALCQVKDSVYARKKRTPLEDGLSVFHESGIAIVSGDPALSACIRNFQWKPLFWEHREQVRQHLRFYIFGHALYQKCMTPYLGLTGHARIYDTSREFFTQPISAQRQQVDLWMAEDWGHSGIIRSPQDLSPFPLLGYPGMVCDNENPSYYENTRYFRPGRSRITSEQR